MNKTLSKPLVIINAVLVLLLLIISALIIFMANSKQKTMFSYQVKLVIGEKLDDKISDKCLVFVKPNDTSNLKKGSYLLYSFEGTSYIIKADKIEGNIISYTNKSGDTLTVDVTTNDYGGRVKFSSNFLGSVLSAVASKETISLTFILIGGIFIISMLSLIIIYAIHMSKLALKCNNKLEYREEMKVFDDDDDNDDYVFEEDSLLICEITNDYDKEFDTNNELEYEINEEVLSSQSQLESEEIFHFAQIQSKEEIFQKKFEEPANPPYYLLDEDIPSVDSLMDNIDAQFGFFDQDDDDIKIFPIKK